MKGCHLLLPNLFWMPQGQVHLSVTESPTHHDSSTCTSSHSGPKTRTFFFLGLATSTSPRPADFTEASSSLVAWRMTTHADFTNAWWDYNQEAFLFGTLVRAVFLYCPVPRNCWTHTVGMRSGPLNFRSNVVSLKWFHPFAQCTQLTLACVHSTVREPVIFFFVGGCW